MKKSVMILLVFVVFIFIGFVNSTTYYADYSVGNDSDVGNSTNPWKTIGPHINSGTKLLSSGDTLILKDGIYNESVNALSGLYSTMTNITILGENKGGALVFFNTSFSRGFYFNGASFNLINFNISTNQSSINCVVFRGSSSNITLENLTFYNCSNALVTYDINSQPSNIHILNNLFVGGTYILNFPNKAFINSTMQNNIFNHNYSFNINNSAENFGEYNLNVSNNTFYGALVINSEEWTEILEENHFYPSSISVQNVTFSNILNLSNFRFTNNRNISISSYYFNFENSSNIILSNISFCSEDNFCYYNTSSGSYVTLVQSDSNSKNISLENSSFYARGGNLRIIYLLGDRSYLKNITLFHNGSSGWGVLMGGNNTLVENNSIYFYNNSISYGIGLGSEGRNYWDSNNTIKNNLIKDLSLMDAGSTHSLFLGYTENSTVERNIIIGGGYNFVIKGNKNCTIKDNFANETRNIGMYEKAGENNLFINNTLYAKNSSDKMIYLAWNNIDFINVTNSTWINNKIYCLNNSINCIYLSIGARDIHFYNTSSNNESISMSDSNTFLERYWPLEISGDSGVSFSLADNQSNTYGTYNSNTYQTTYFLQYNKTSSLQANYTPYNLTASKSGYYSKLYSLDFNQARSLYISLALIPVATTPTSSPSSSGLITSFITTQVSDERMEEGYRKVLRVNNQIKFEYNNKTTFARVISISQEEVVVNISSVDYTVKINETEKIDLNRDGYYDLEIKVDSVSNYGSANMEFKIIYEEIPKQEQEKVNENVEEEVVNENIPKVEKKNTWKYLTIGMGVIILILIIFLSHNKIKRKKRYKKFGY